MSPVPWMAGGAILGLLARWAVMRYVNYRWMRNR